MVNKARWIEATAELVREKKLEGIADIRDESDRAGIRVVFELKRDAPEQVVLNNLYKMTALQTSFGINMLAIVDGRPQLLGLRQALTIFLEHRREVVTRRSLHDLREARLRREIVEGLGLAVITIDRVIEIIRSSKDTDEARTRLMAEKMGGLEGFLERAGRPAGEIEAARQAGFVFLSQRQAQAILDMRLARLTGLEREKLEAEYKELWALTDYLEGLLADEAKLMACIIDELEQIRDQYGDDRRTEIVGEVTEILNEELIAEEDMVVTRTHQGYVKRTPVTEYTAQSRGGRGIRGAQSGGADDFVADMFVASSHDYLLLFTSNGRIYQKRVFELPAGARTARGKPVVNFVELQDGEQVVSVLPVKELRAGQVPVHGHPHGHGQEDGARRVLQHPHHRHQGDRHPRGRPRWSTCGWPAATWTCCWCTKNGYAVRFQEDKVRPMGRDARGVRGINLRKDDMVVGMGVFERDSTQSALIVCERGYGKRTALSEFPTKNRGGKGVIAIKTTDRNGQVAGAARGQRRGPPDPHLHHRPAHPHPGQHRPGGRPRHPGRARHAPGRGRAGGVDRAARRSRTRPRTSRRRAAPEGGADDGDTVPVEMDDVVGDERRGRGRRGDAHGDGDGSDEEDDK